MEWLGPSFEVGKLCGSDSKGDQGEKLLVAELVMVIHTATQHWRRGRGWGGTSPSYVTNWT